MLNGGALNSAPINDFPFTSVTASGSLVQIEQSVSAAGAGGLISIEQSVAMIASGSLITIEQATGHGGAGSILDIEQDVILAISGSGPLLTIEQSNTATASGPLVTLEQRVRDLNAVMPVHSQGWDLELFIAGQEISHSQIHGQINITRTENGAALMDVTIINEAGVLGLAKWHGQDITLDAETVRGWQRTYTGTVDIPEHDLVNKLITLRCTDKREEQINNQLGDELQFIGTHSTAIFNEPDDVAEELSQRLQTTLKTVDFDQYGQYTISDYLPKATPDFTFNDAGIYRRTPQLDLASRGRLVNQVVIDFEYRFSRLRERTMKFELETGTFCDVITKQAKFLVNDNVRSSLKSFGWDVDFSSLAFDPLPDAGWYRCHGENFHDEYGQALSFVWNPTPFQGQTVNVTDDEGSVVKDGKGNAITENVITSWTDYRGAQSLSVGWKATKRFAQDVTQKSVITINAPQSQDQYGIIKKSQSNGYEHKYNGEWESGGSGDDVYTAVGGGGSGVGSGIANGVDSYLDAYGDLNKYTSTVNSAIAIARTTIAKSHRDNHVVIQIPIQPELDLKHTVETTAGLIKARGKITRLVHTFDITNRFANTECRFSLSRATGSATTDDMTVNIAPTPYIGDNYPSQADMTPADGIVTPAIDDNSRKRHEIEINYDFDLELRNDLLEVTY